MFFRGSRYLRVPEAEWEDDDKRKYRYKKIRFIPDLVPQAAHVVTQEERLDLIAHGAWREPEKFWRICDANAALWPDSLVLQPGRVLKLPAADD